RPRRPEDVEPDRGPVRAVRLEREERRGFGPGPREAAGGPGGVGLDPDQPSPPVPGRLRRPAQLAPEPGEGEHAAVPGKERADAGVEPPDRRPWPREVGEAGEQRGRRRRAREIVGAALARGGGPA